MRAEHLASRVKKRYDYDVMKILIYYTARSQFDTLAWKVGKGDAWKGEECLVSVKNPRNRK